MNLDIAVDTESLDLVDVSAEAGARPFELSAAQKLDLVSRLANDDAFRELFRADNAAAMRAIGVSDQDLPGILDVTRTNCRLGEKALFADVLRQMLGGQFALAMAMQTPQVKVV